MSRDILFFTPWQKLHSVNILIEGGGQMALKDLRRRKGWRKLASSNIKNSIMDLSGILFWIFGQTRQCLQNWTATLDDIILIPHQKPFPINDTFLIKKSKWKLAIFVWNWRLYFILDTRPIGVRGNGKEMMIEQIFLESFQIRLSFSTFCYE